MTMTPTSKTWFITGATRGLGAEIARAALAAGDRVAATGRDTSKIAAAFDAPADQLLPIQLDVTNAEQAGAAVAAATAKFGGIDILVNNAGYGQLGLFEETEPEDAERQFATNVFGLFSVTRAVLPVMRRQRSGRIFNVTSVGGIRGTPAGTLYCSSKFAVEGFSEALAMEVEPFGIKVTIVGPGSFRTDFLDESSVRFAKTSIDDYAETAARIAANFAARNGQQAGDPAKLGAALVDLASRETLPLRFAVGSDAVNMVAAKIERLTADLNAFRDLSSSTDGTYASALRIA